VEDENSRDGCAACGGGRHEGGGGARGRKGDQAEDCVYFIREKEQWARKITGAAEKSGWKPSSPVMGLVGNKRKDFHRVAGTGKKGWTKEEIEAFREV